MVLAFGGTIYGTDCLPCNGASLDRTTYPELFAAIGVNWGSADSAHFNVPDLRDRAPFGVGSSLSMGQTDGKSSGNRGPFHHHAFSGNTSSDGSHSHSFNAMQPDYEDYYGSYTPTFMRGTQRSGSTGSVGNHSHSVSGNTTGGYAADTPGFGTVQFVISTGRTP